MLASSDGEISWHASRTLLALMSMSTKDKKKAGKARTDSMSASQRKALASLTPKTKAVCPCSLVTRSPTSFQKKNPKTESGNRRHRHHQHFTDTGSPHLDEQIRTIIGEWSLVRQPEPLDIGLLGGF